MSGRLEHRLRAGCVAVTALLLPVPFAAPQHAAPALEGVPIVSVPAHSGYPGCNYLNADANHDGVVSFLDINPFVALVATP